MIASIIKIGDRIELTQISTARVGEKKPAVYISQLLDIVDDTNINIAVPIQNGRLIPLEVGVRYEIRILTVSGLYICRGRIVNRFKQNNIYFLAVNIISDLRRDQRRQYYRLDCIIPVKYHSFNEEESKLEERLENEDYKDETEKNAILEEYRRISHDEQGTVTNISGGGLKFCSGEGFNCGDRIIVRFFLTDINRNSEFKLQARVIASEKIPNKNMLFEHRIEYTDINREKREEIVRYVFREERKQRQKGLGNV